MFGSRTQKTTQKYEQVAKKTYTWRSSDKAFVYYDSEKKERVALPKGAKLIPLTTTNSVTGNRERDHGRATARWNLVSSNEFTDYRNENIKVVEYDRLDKSRTVVFEGTYSGEIRDAISGLAWANFTKNIYCLYDGEVIKLALSKAGLTAWIEFEDKLKETNTYLTDGHCIYLDKAKECTTGMVKYFAPVFGVGDISEEDNKKADEVAEKVEEALARNQAALASRDSSAPAQVEVPAAPQTETATTETVNSAEDTVSLEEIPF